MNDIDPKDIIPTSNRMVVIPDEKPNKTEGGLELGGNSTNNAPVKGTILTVGDKSQFTAGTIVLFRRYAIDELKIQTPTEEKTIYFLEDSDILGTVKVDELPIDKSIKYPQITMKKELEQINHADEKTTSSIKDEVSEAGSSKEVDEKGL